MPTRAVRDWLAEYKALPETELHTYANTVRNNDELVDALYDLFEEESSQEVLEPVCHQLFDFYRCGNAELQRFTLEAIPVMITAYLTAYSQNDKKRCSGIEACLLGVYNLEVIGEDGKPKVKSYTIPTLAVPSVYHEPPSLATLALTESALLKHHSEEHVKITVGPLPQVERIHSQNRLPTLTNLLRLYNADIGNLSPRSHFAICKMASRLTKTGFGNLIAPDEAEMGINLNDSGSSHSSRSSRRGVQFRMERRIQLSSAFLVELLNGIYFAMFNGQAREGIQALEDIHSRASYELYADVLLVTNAIKNSLQYNPSGQPQDGPMGISIALSPSQSSPAFSKSAITNASFRTKKLPDDIEVLTPEKNERPPLHRPPSYCSLPTSSPLSKEEFLLANSTLDRLEILDIYDKQLQEQENLSKTKKSSTASKKELGVGRSNSRDSESGRSETIGKGKTKLGSFKRGSKRDRKSVKSQEDIDVPEDEKHQAARQASGTDQPPHYDDIITTTSATNSTIQNTNEERSSTSSKHSSTKLSKPLKSIMKKGANDKPSKTKSKDADSSVKRDRKSGSLNVNPTEFQDSPKNPKHSISMTTGLGMSGNSQNGVSEFTDPAMVGVSVVRSSSSATGKTFQMVDYIDLKQSNQAAANHKRASSISEDSVGSGVKGQGQGQGHSREVSNASTYDAEGLDFNVMEELEDAEESIDTAL